MTVNKEVLKKAKHIKHNMSFNDMALRIVELEQSREAITKEVSDLARAMWTMFYQKSAPEFQLCDTPEGVISQIDNMIAGLISHIQNMEKSLPFVIAAGNKQLINFCEAGKAKAEEQGKADIAASFDSAIAVISTFNELRSQSHEQPKQAAVQAE